MSKTANSEIINRPSELKSSFYVDNLKELVETFLDADVDIAHVNIASYST